MKSQPWRWVLGLIYILAVATIWIAASYVVQSVVDEGVSPFLVTYICNSLFVVYIPLVEVGRYLEDKYGTILFWRNREEENRALENEILLENDEAGAKDASRLSSHTVLQQENADQSEEEVIVGQREVLEDGKDLGLDAKRRWTRKRVAKVSLLISPFWYMAQLTFNLSLKYTTVTSNTILSSSSSLFTFLVALVFLGEKFTWIKLISVLLCMGGTIIVSLEDSKFGLSAVATNPFLGDIMSLVSSAFYAVYVTLIRKKLPDDEDEAVQGHASMAQFLGFLGLFNLILFLPVALILGILKLESFRALSGKQFGLIVGKGLLDNVLSDYLWAKAVLLTTTTVATAGLSIQVPLAAIVDSLKGHPPHLLNYIGGAAIMVGFTGFNVPSGDLCGTKEENVELESVTIIRDNHEDL